MFKLHEWLDSIKIAYAIMTSKKQYFLTGSQIATNYLSSKTIGCSKEMSVMFYFA